VAVSGRADDHRGSREVEPARRRKRTPSDQRRSARRLLQRIEATAVERQQTWHAGGLRDLSSALTRKLNGHDSLYDEGGLYSSGGLYGEKRAERP
jgi:hypothetical protein